MAQIISEFILSNKLQIKTIKDIYIGENILSNVYDIYSVDKGILMTGGDWESIPSYITFIRDGDMLIFSNRTLSQDELFKEFYDEDLFDEVFDKLEKHFSDCNYTFFINTVNLIQQQDKVIYKLTDREKRIHETCNKLIELSKIRTTEPIKLLTNTKIYKNNNRIIVNSGYLKCFIEQDCRSLTSNEIENTLQNLYYLNESWDKCFNYIDKKHVVKTLHEGTYSINDLWNLFNK